jgi:hypothetical protein
MTFLTLLRPKDDPVRMWAMQNLLLDEAERLLGGRDLSKKIYKSEFVTDGKGPQLINTPNFDSASAMLSVNAAGYWPTAVYELSH